MLFVVLFEDNPGQDHLRQTHMSGHLAFLEAHGGCLGAGPVFAPDGTGRGGMWLVEADNAAAVETMVQSDPFYPTGLRKSITILEWRQVFRDGQRIAPSAG